MGFSILRGGLLVKTVIPDDSEIITACKRGDISTVQRLFMSRRSSPYDVTESNCGPLRFAIESGSLELVKLLCHYGADANTTFGQFETSPLEWAFRTRHIEIARFFLTQGASLDYLCYRGWTPAMLLFQKDFPEVPPEFFGLLSCNSFTDIDVQDRYGATVLHRAALWGTIGDINALLRLGASPLLMDTDVGWTPAFGAASMNNAAVLKRLVEIMLPDFVHHIDFRGRTILHIAIESGGPEAIVFALELGADPHQPSRIVVDEGGAATEVTPYEFANLKGSDIYEVFIRALQMVGHSISTVEGLYVLGYSGAKVHMTRLVYHAGIIRRRNSA
ncbi:ankyrin repeat-containing domain protein [Fusarium oxysporum f. sp. albedinis]|nr:ankyrin repeat-containing domain protein [Fusarium oxysporum f. sp. albedinis]